MKKYASLPPVNWSALQQQALLGIQRKPLDTGILPEALVALLPASGEPAARLLHAIAAAHLWRQAGWQSTASEVVLPDPAPAEVLHYLPERLARIFPRLFAPGADLPLMQQLWLRVCQENNWVVQPDMITTLLDLGAIGKQKKRYRTLVSQVVGQRGKWLAQFNPAWSYLESGETEAELWQKGAPDTRREVFIRWRIANPQAALEKLTEIWEKEPVRERKAWIEALDTGLNNADIPFLEQVLTAYANADKPALEDIRLAAIQRLLCLPESTLSQDLWKIIQSIISLVTNSKLLGLTQNHQLVVAFPARTQLEQWCTQFGLDSANQAPDFYTAEQFMLRRLIGWIPPACWKLLAPQMSVSQIFQLFTQGEQMVRKTPGQKTPFAWYVAGLIEATVRFNDQTWAVAISQALEEDTPASLIPLLPIAEQEAIFTRYGFDSAEKLRLMLDRGQWSLPMSQAYLKWLKAAVMRSGYYYFPYHKELIALALHPDCRPELRYWADNPAYQPTDRWLRTFAVELLELMAIKEAITLYSAISGAK